MHTCACPPYPGKPEPLGPSASGGAGCPVQAFMPQGRRGVKV